MGGQGGSFLVVSLLVTHPTPASPAVVLAGDEKCSQSFLGNKLPPLLRAFFIGQRSVQEASGNKLPRFGPEKRAFANSSFLGDLLGALCFFPQLLGLLASPSPRLRLALQTYFALKARLAFISAHILILVETSFSSYKYVRTYKYSPRF